VTREIERRGDMTDSRNMTAIAIHALEDRKAEDIRVIDITDVSVIADYFIIASGKNALQVQALSDSVEEALGKAGFEPRHIEGYRSANWILMDYNDIIIHIFSEDQRIFYDLERIWRDGKVMDTDAFAD
jgi:ribosome-associated protein